MPSQSKSRNKNFAVNIHFVFISVHSLHTWVFVLFGGVAKELHEEILERAPISIAKCVRKSMVCEPVESASYPIGTFSHCQYSQLCSHARVPAKKAWWPW